MIPRKIFEFQERLATGNCRNVHSEGLHDLYSLANIIGGDNVFLFVLWRMFHECDFSCVRYFCYRPIARILIVTTNVLVGKTLVYTLCTYNNKFAWNFRCLFPATSYYHTESWKYFSQSPLIFSWTKLYFKKTKYLFMIY